MTEDLLYQIALTTVPQIGNVQAKALALHFGNAKDIFKAKLSVLESIEGINTPGAKNIKAFTDFSKAEQELKFIQKYNVQPLFILDKNYPQRLLNCYDSPTLLFYKGKADLNASRIVSIIGTRKNSEYGRSVTEKLIESLAAHNVLIVSGLAFGIDVIAHKTSVNNNIPTVAVVAHGLDQIYPADHSNLAKEMVQYGGGILTEYPSNTKPEKYNFPSRNRIVAGMSDATIVIETTIKGGSMITAELANGYNKDVFAFPGKVTDSKSSGCNHLIKTNKANLITEADDLLAMLNWTDEKKPKKQTQRQLFIDLNENEKRIVDILKEQDTIHIDELNMKSKLSSGTVASAILSLELQNVIVSLPGKLYQLA